MVPPIEWVTRFGRLKRVRTWPTPVGEPELFDRIDRAVQSLTPEHFDRPGRTVTLPLPRSGYSVKLKGLCNCTSDGRLTGPSTKTFLRENPHLGFSAGDHFRFVSSAPAPLGGIVLSRARAELDAAEALTAGTIPHAPWPLALFRFVEPRLSFEASEGREALGASLLVCRGENYQRIDKLLDGRPWSDGLESLERILAALGGALKALHAAGWYRYSSTLDNCHLDPDGTIQLVDLDSSRRLGDLTPRRQWLERARDLAGAMFNTAAFLMAPERASQLAPHLLPAGALFRTLLIGYVEPALQPQAARVASRFADWFREPYARVHARAADLLALAPGAERQALLRTLWMDRAEAYSGLMALITADRLNDWPGSDDDSMIAWRAFVSREADGLAASNGCNAWWRKVAQGIA